MFVTTCSAGVITTTTTSTGIRNTVRNHVGATAAVRPSDPTTKSSWSRPGNAAPRSRPLRRLRNDAPMSPSIAPKESANADFTEKTGSVTSSRVSIDSRTTSRTSARTTPANVPTSVPRQVFPSPRSRFPFHETPPSIGLPPPASTATLFGTYAGSIVQNACRTSVRNIEVRCRGEDIIPLRFG